MLVFIMRLTAQQKKNLYYLVPLIVLLIGTFLFYFLAIRVRPNDKILTNSEGVALFANENPTFEVQFGDKENPGGQWIRFEAKTSNDNPFSSEEKKNIFTKIASIFTPKKKSGIEMSLRGVDYSETNTDGKAPQDEEMQKVADILGTEEIKTSTVLTEIGREIGKNEGDQIISKQTIVNQGVADGVDLEYQVLKGLGLKEEIVINDLEAYRNSCDEGCKLPLNEFVFDLKVDDGVVLKKGWFTVDGKSSEVYYFVNGNGKYLAHFLPSYAVDDAGDKTYEVDLTINEVKVGNYEAKVTVNSDWLLDANRVYPIRIDPSIVHDDTTDFSGGVFDRTESVTGPKVQLLAAKAPIADTNTVGLWHLDEASGSGAYVLDSSTVGNHGTPTGTTYTNPGKIGGARSFNGTTDYIRTAVANYQSASSLGTMEAWIKLNSLTSSQTIFQSADEATDSYWLQFRVNVTTGTLSILQRNNDTYDQVSGTTALSVNRWYHVAVVSSGTAYSLYIDGVAENLTIGSGANTGDWFSDTPNRDNIMIGMNKRSTSSDYMNGYIDEVRISNVARTALQIQSSYLDGISKFSGIYTSSALDLGSSVLGMTMSWLSSGVNTGNGETPYSTTGMVAQWNFNETSGTTAVSGGTCGTSCNGTLTNMTTTGQDAAALTGWTANNRRWGTGAVMFDGSNDHVSVSDNPSLNFADGQNFSIEAWVKISVGGKRHSIVSKGGEMIDGSSPIYTLYVDTDNKLKFSIGDVMTGTIGMISAVGTSNLADNNWHLVTGTFDNSTIKVYKDGNLEGSANGSALTVIGGTEPVRIGSGRNGNTFYYLSGVIDSTRIYSRALSANEILSNYQSGNIEFQYRTSTDNSTWSNWTSYNDGALMFDGTDDYVNVGDIAAVDALTSFSTCAWVNNDTMTADSMIWSKVDNSTWSGIMFVKDIVGQVSGRTNTYKIWVGQNSAAAFIEGATNSATTGAWQHVCATFTANSATGLHLYVNGVEDANSPVSTVGITGFDSGTNALSIGRYNPSAGTYLDGSIDNIQIYNRVLAGAEITSNYNVSDFETPYSSTGLLANWKFNELSDTTAISGGICGISCNGTLTNFSSTTGRDSATTSGWTAKTKLGSDYPEYSFDNPYLYKTDDTGLVGYWPMEEVSGSGAYIKDVSATPFAVGGVVAYSGGYTIHTFKTSGTFTVNGSGKVEVLVVAGGGGGGQELGGGGGGGGYIYNSGYSVSSGSMNITIGNGGTAIANNGVANNGGNSVFGTLTAIGGGGGGGATAGAAGGSGGGGGVRNSANYLGGSGTAGQGNNGGQANYGTWTALGAGGGGGATSVGSNGAANKGGNGGSGYTSSISGASVIYAGGGGGGAGDGQTPGYGTGGGGNGSATSGVRGSDGTANTGGGGGGGGGGAGSWAASAGGSGVVIVRYPSSYTVTTTDTIGDATPSGTTSVDGKQGNARNLNVAASNYINAGNNSSLALTSTYTLSAWIYLTSNCGSGSGNMIISKAQYGSLNGGFDWGCITESGYTNRMYIINQTSAGQDIYRSTASMSAGQWHYVAVTFASGIPKLYVDGIQVTGAFDSGSSLRDAGINSNNLFIGNHNIQQTLALPGYIDEARVFNIALTASTISFDYIKGITNKSSVISQSGSSLKTEGIGSTKLASGPYVADSNTVGLWHMDERSGSGAYIKDSSSSTLLSFATGGTITYTDSNGQNPRSSPAYAGGYTVHTFTTGGTFAVNGAGNVEVLAVAGGGGGVGGGGGGGGIQYNSAFAISSAGTITVTVGNGGTGGGTGSNGGDSVFSTITATGGGGGAAYDTVGKNGGTGGGGASDNGTTYIGGTGSQGYGGGTAYNGQSASGGGGSMGAAGGNTSQDVGGAGGVGVAYSISGTSTYYGGGGGGGARTTGGAGGTGGGGAGGSGGGTAGTVNTGGGGGGGWATGGGAGGSGIVIVRYPSSQMGGTNGNHATPTGTTYANAGKIGGARVFNGTSDYLSVADNDSFYLGTSSFTMSAWVNLTNSTTAGHGFYVQQVDANNRIMWGIDQTNIQFYASSGGTALASYSGTHGITANVWTYITLVRDGTNLRIYVNGVEKTMTVSTAIASNSLPNYAASIRLGSAYFNGAWQYLNGTMDEFVIMRAAKTSSEIFEAYKLGKDTYINQTINTIDLSNKNTLGINIAGDRPGTYLSTTWGESAFANYQPDANTVGLWHIDEVGGSGAYIKDISGSSNNGTPTGTTYTSNGKLGGARSFNGSSDVFKTGTNSSLNINGTLTLSAWIKASTDVTNYRMIISKEESPSINPYRLYLASSTGIPNFNDMFTNGGVTGTIALNDDKWHYIVVTRDDSAKVSKMYIDGVLNAQGVTYSGTNPQATSTTETWVGKTPYSDRFPFFGTIDEVRVDNVARSADQIRQAYEVGLRTHNITVTFGAGLASGNLIANSGDTSFNIDATKYGLPSLGSELYAGDKVIVKENYNGTEYIAQGTVTSVNLSTGATVVASWDSGSTFPSGGYTVNADVFKWQKEYISVKNRTISTQVDATNLLTFRLNDGNEGRNIWIDDLRSSTGYLKNSASEVITFPSNAQYVQYKTVFSSWDSNVTPYISQVQVDYASGGPTIDQLMRHGQWLDSSGAKKGFWWVGTH